MSIPIFKAFQASGLAKVIHPDADPSKDDPEPENIPTNIVLKSNQGMPDFHFQTATPDKTNNAIETFTTSPDCPLQYHSDQKQ